MFSFNAMGSPFDMNGDGQMDIWEQSAEMMALFKNPFDDSNSLSDRVREEIEEALEEQGYTLNDLQNMDPDEIRGILENVGIDPE